jgi:hypothetical protein
MKSGREAISQGRLDRAITVFRRISDHYPYAPERPEATLLLAQSLEAHGDSALALVEYRRLTAEFPQMPQALLARAKIPDIERQMRLPSASAAGPVGTYIPVSRISRLDEREFFRLRQGDTDTVVLEVARQSVSRSGRREAGVYFKTDWAPVIQDSLATIVSSAHQAQIQVWAALSIRRMDWIEPRLGWSDWRYDPASGELVLSDTVDLFHPAVWEYLLGLLMDLAATGIDGIFFMAEPSSGAVDGFSPFALRAYQRDMGQLIDPALLQLRPLPALNFAPEFWRWIGWKQREQLKAVDGIVRALRHTYPKLNVAVEVHPESITNPRAAIAWYAEDFLDFRHSQADYVAVSLLPTQAGAVKPLMESMNEKRLLVIGDPAAFPKTALSSFPKGSGLIYKDKLTSDSLTKDRR